MRRDESYRGFEVWFNDLKMAVKMHWVLGIALGCAHLVLFGLVARAWLGEIESRILWHWVVSRVGSFSSGTPGTKSTSPTKARSTG